MHDNTKPEKVKREYRATGAALAVDIRVRLDTDTAEKLTAAAKRQQISRAALARRILQSAMNPATK